MKIRHLILSIILMTSHQAAAQVAPQVKILSIPRPVLQPAVKFLARAPVIDGRLDGELQGLERRPFAALVKMNPAAPDTVGEYRLAYGCDFLYVFIDIEAERLTCRDRGYQNGDGFILVLNRPKPDGAESPELVMLAYHPAADPEQPFRQMVWKRNDDWPFSPLGKRSAFRAAAEGGRTGFEALLRWEDVPPYHPWLAEGLGFNILFSKACGETDVNFLAVNLKPAPGPEAFSAYSRMSFAAPAIDSGTRGAAILENGHLRAGEPLRLKIAAVSARASREKVNFSILSDGDKPVSSQTIDVDLGPGLTVRDAVLDTQGLPPGGYTVRWEFMGNTEPGKGGITVLPAFDAAEKEKECNAAQERIGPGSLQTIRFLLADIAADRSRLRPSDTCPGLLAKMERADILLRAASSGDDLLAKESGFLRRAFLSEVDGTLQPYTISVPAQLESGKTYPALVFLHGSDSDDRSVRASLRAFPPLFLEQGFVIAPYGRGPSNGFSRDHAQEDIREAVADALRHYPIDPARLVLAGFSMGGYGVYRTLYENPKMYRAAAVFSGEPSLSSAYAAGGSHPDFGRPEFLEPLRGMNIAVIHGGRDRNCPVELTNGLVAVLKQSGIPVLFLLDKEAGHEFPRDASVVAEYSRWLDAALRPAAADRFEPVRKVIQEKMKKEGLPSMAVAVARNGEIVWEEAWGFADVEKKIPATPRTMYSLASTTKPITATALMILVERGLVDLDQPANLYLGEARLTGVRPEEATVRRLLRHTAGLPLHWNLIFADEAYKRPDMDETIRRYGVIVAPPGEGFSYSNLGYGILERIIERVSKKAYADFLKAEVFDPLGMTRSAVLLEQGAEADVAKRYTQQGRPFPFFDFDHRGASAAYSSAHDLVRFGMFHLGNRLPDQKQILNARTKAAMQRENRPRAPESAGSIGWSSYRVNGIHVVAHSGGMFGVGARLTLLPEKNVACVVLTNASTGMQGTDLWDVEWEIFKAVIPGFPEAPERPAPPPAPAAFEPPDLLLGVWEGKVRTEGRDLPVKLTVEKGGSVRLELEGKVSAAFTAPPPFGSTRFRDGVLLAPFMAGLKTADAARSPHILFLGAKLRGDKLDGALSAVAMNQRFCYSHWIELKRRK